MTTAYGTDLRALDDFPDRDDYVSGLEGLAYALGRRLLTPTGGLADCGDPAHYESLDLRVELGARFAPGDDALLAARCRLCIVDDERVQTAAVRVRRAGGELNVEVDAVADDGPFSFVLTVDALSVARLEIA